MKTRYLFITIVLFLILTLGAAWAVQAQGGRPPGPLAQQPADPFTPPFLHARGAWDATNAPAHGDDLTLGRPGLSFRYVKTFGETRKGYLDDTNHFYEVHGLGLNGDNIWLTDSWGDRVLEFDANGNFIRQIGKAGFRDATGTSLDYVNDVASDSSGNVWVVDAGANHVVKYDATGKKIQELGKAWQGGSDNEHFNNPISIAFDGHGNIYVSDSGVWGDWGNHRVQIFDPSGNYLATIGETGQAGDDNQHLHRPRGLAVDRDLLYVADTANHRVQIFDISTPTTPTYVATLGESGVSGSDNAHLNSPEGVGVDSKYIYVADSDNDRVQVFDKITYVYVATIGAGEWGQDNTHFNHPTDVIIDSHDHIYVADAYNKRVQQYDQNRVYVRTYGTTGVSYVTDGYHYYFPKGVAVAQDGSIYIVEERGHRLVKLDASGEPQWTVGEPGQAGSDHSHFFGPVDVAVDPQGRVYVAESWGNNRVQVFDSDGHYVGTVNKGWGTGDGYLRHPDGLGIDRNGTVYVADTANHRVEIFDAQWHFIASIGETNVPGSDNNHFNEPDDVAVDSRGFIYVADKGNNRVQVFDRNRHYVRTIGLTGGSGNDFARFNGPHRLAVDELDRLYVADSWNNRIQVFDSSGNYLTTIGGRYGDGSGQFINPHGVAVDVFGAVYVADEDNNRIQKFALGVPGWAQMNINGFGDPKVHLTSLSVFNDRLYAGTYKFASHGAQIWRMDAPGQWAGVMTNGFGQGYNVGIDDMAVFKGKLYAGVWNSTPYPPYTDTGGEIWRSSDGETWEETMSGGFGDRYNGEVMTLAPFDDYLYAATWSYTTTHGAEIWRSATGDTNDWTRVVTNGFGSAANQTVLSLVSVGDYLYASTYNYDGTAGVTHGGEIWRTGDGEHWQKVVSGGFGDTNNYAILGMSVFDQNLYAGTYYWDFQSHRPGRAQLWRCPLSSGCDEQSDWEQVVGDGFGDSANYAIEGVISQNGMIYAITRNRETGIEVWRSATGDAGDWQQIGFGGFGDANNYQTYWGHAITAYQNNLYVGTINGGNGGEVWGYLPTHLFLPVMLH